MRFIYHLCGELLAPNEQSLANLRGIELRRPKLLLKANKKVSVYESASIAANACWVPFSLSKSLKHKIAPLLKRLFRLSFFELSLKNIQLQSR